MPPIPDIPGALLSNEHTDFLRKRVAHLCGLERYRFPGSQPISFSKKEMSRLEQEDYWIDRNDQYRSVSGFYFPHHTDIRRAIGDTILDGELVNDLDPQTHTRMKEWFFKPYEKVLREIPALRERPFDIQIKPMELSYHVDKVIREDVPKLQHETDGLIYTCAESAYVVGTDERILKWKPPSENSIDFRLELRFPPLPSEPSQPNLHAKPQFILKAWTGGRDRGKGKQRETYEYFDIMNVDDDEWEKMKTSGEQIDDRVIEVRWDIERLGWRMMRFRDDKPEGNHCSVVDKIVQSIIDGVEQAELIENADNIKRCWKEREMRRRNQPQLVPHPHPHHPHPQFNQPPPMRLMPSSQIPSSEGPPRLYTRLGPPILNKVQGPDVVEGMRR
ncbi:hypothetical protein Clacol_006814 [Clathrus columnatus]|uniref:mRNA guanylyltransferase n=1 Tax=Clathrus columnatus TaxID=1419009 RepID=A0AAV5AD50_9AGAM|nr:hypothetical protein Clacol_006814 [Clathrus columnatus]